MFKNSNKTGKEIIFIIIGISLLLAIIGFVVFSMNFLIKNIGVAMNQDSSKTQKVIRFNLEGLEKLGVIK